MSLHSSGLFSLWTASGSIDHPRMACLAFLARGKKARSRCDDHSVRGSKPMLREVRASLGLGCSHPQIDGDIRCSSEGWVWSPRRTRRGTKAVAGLLISVYWSVRPALTSPSGGSVPAGPWVCCGDLNSRSALLRARKTKSYRIIRSDLGRIWS